MNTVVMHLMTPDGIHKAFARLEYQRDKRRPPDQRRRGQFRSGWKDATTRGDVYADSTLEQLTWRNLGYRLGKFFGHQTPEEIDGAFDVLAVLYEGHRPQTSSSFAPSPEQYVDAFRKIGNVSENQIQMLRLHYHAPARTITASQMARAIGYDHYSIVNSQYGRLGKAVGDQLKYNPKDEVELGSLVTFEKRQGEWHWIMRPEVAQALELLGWVEEANFLLPEEIAATTALVEGAACRVSVNAYERNPEARRLCIERHGITCCVCGFSFGAVYGEVAEGYIHVHHLRPLSEIGREYVVDPVEDLRPVCPNCHAVLHRRIPAYSIEEVREFMMRR